MHRVDECSRRKVSRGCDVTKQLAPPPGFRSFGREFSTVMTWPEPGQPGDYCWAAGNDSGEEKSCFTRQPMPGTGPERPQQVISVTLLRFYEGNCKLWLTLAENIFKLKGIFNETQRFKLALSAFCLRHLENLGYVLDNLSSCNPYTQLRKEIMRVFGPTEEENLDRFLCDVQLGDKRSTELLYEMRRLMGEQYCPALLEKLFKEKLPSMVRRIIAAVPSCHLDEFAWRADSVMKKERSEINKPDSFRGATLCLITSKWNSPRGSDWRSNIGSK